MAQQNSTAIDEDELCCPICFEDYVLSDRKRHPKLLLCLHTFCFSCIINLQRYNNGILQCSICRAEHELDSINDLLDNDAIHYQLRKKQELEDKKYAYRVSQRDDDDDTDSSESEEDDLIAEINTTSSDADSDPITVYSAELALLYDTIIPGFIRIAQLQDEEHQQQQHEQQMQEQQQRQQQQEQQRQQQQEQQRQQQQQEQQRQQQQEQQRQQQQEQQRQQQQQEQKRQQQQQKQRQQQQQRRQQQQQQQQSEHSRKIFVGGVRGISQSDLFHCFRRYGTIERIDLKNGFAFIVFTTPAPVNKVIGIHVINDVQVVVEKYHNRGYKIYVGGILHLSQNEVQSYFGRFGVLKGVELPMTRNDFCFIIYEEEREMLAALYNKRPEVGGSQLRIQRFNPTLWNG